jgi:hypothetical protein
MKRIIAALAAFLAMSVALADENWMSVGENTNAFYALRKHTGHFGKNKKGEELYIATVRTIHKDDQRIDLSQMYVKLTDCERGSGKITTVQLDGTFEYTNDWLTGAGSIASDIAEVLCSTQVKQRERDTEHDVGPTT